MNSNPVRIKAPKRTRSPAASAMPAEVALWFVEAREVDPPAGTTPAPGSLAWVPWICARLGGWTGYYGKPGPITIYNGFMRLKHMLHGWAIKGLA